jgi:hypothetical protein
MASLKLIGNLIVRLGAAIDCMRAISDGMIGVACRHTNFNSYTQI